MKEVLEFEKKTPGELSLLVRKGELKICIYEDGERVSIASSSPGGDTHVYFTEDFSPY
jgi:hypothetical protein